jgi:hypothetical protein
MRRWALKLETLEPRLTLAADLVITEVHYDPLPAPPESDFTDPDDFEFIEIQNVGSQARALAGVSFTAGISFTFGNIVLPPGAHVVVARNAAAFAERYGASPSIAGEYTGELSNSSETITLRDAANAVLQSFAYDSQWYKATSGVGHSLVVRDAQAASNSSLASGWHPSSRLHGSPGALDTGLYPGAVVINEILTHQDGPPGDWIELHNTAAFPINIGGWFLSDSDTATNRYRIADNTVIQPGGYLLYTQDIHFGPLPQGVNGFALSELGEVAVLTVPAGPGGEIYGDMIAFGALDNGVTLGRHLRTDASADLTLLSFPTRGAANSGPRLGPIVINEIMYNPDTGEEFIELFNPTAQAVRLFDPQNPANSWKLTKGLTFTFPTDLTIPAGGYMLLVDDEPASFRAANSVPAGVPIFSYEGGGGLDNSGEEIEISRPGVPEPPESENPGFVPYYMVDRVNYRDRAPWPTQPDGNGPSLLKRSPLLYSNDAANWTVGVAGGSPGRGDSDLVGPKVVEVRVGGTTWARPSIAIPVGTPAQLAPLPWATIDQITITFSEPVMIGADALAVEGVNVAQYAVTTDVAADVPTLFATWTISQKLPADRLQLDLESELVLDAAGNLLDGDWANAASQFPSGNGTNGGDFRFRFNVLPGDVDQNGTVELADRQSVVAGMFNYLGLPEYRDVLDIDGNGKITIADLVRVRNHLGDSLPVDAAAPASIVANDSTRPAARKQAAGAAIITARRMSREPLLPAAIDTAIAEPKPSLARLRAVRARRPLSTD